MNKKDLLTESIVNAIHSEGKMTESVDWGYYNKFKDITDKYMSNEGEGETFASQIVTAINKLIYKWYNDGDVFDNVHSSLEGWANDLSSYANWLYKYVDGTQDTLKEIYGMGDESDYETLLQELADEFLDEDFLAQTAKAEKQGSIYDCDGPFEFSEYNEEDEEEDYYDDDEYLDSIDESKKCESRVHRKLSVGDTFQNENGVSVVILDVDDKDQVTYRFSDGKTECHPMENVNNMLNENGYTKLNESKEIKTESFTARENFEAYMKRYKENGTDVSGIKVLAENEDFILTGSKDEDNPNRIYLDITTGSYRYVEVFLDQNYKGKIDSAKINWSAIGSVDTTETEEFIKHLQLAIDFCKEIDGKDFSSEME